jgi:hypothetical protein
MERSGSVHEAFMQTAGNVGRLRPFEPGSSIALERIVENVHVHASKNETITIKLRILFKTFAFLYLKLLSYLC